LLDFRAEPKHAPSAAEGDDRTRHVGITALVKAHVPRLRETKDLGNVASVNEVVGVDKWRHVSERISEYGSVRRDP
jgi:hypothetical protein